MLLSGGMDNYQNNLIIQTFFLKFLFSPLKLHMGIVRSLNIH